MKVSAPRPLLTMAIIAVTAPAFAQVQSSGMAAVSRTEATTRVEQPATLTSSQDLMFALQTPVIATLTLPPAISSAAASAASSVATATPAAARAASAAATGSTQTTSSANGVSSAGETTSVGGTANGTGGALSRTTVTSLTAPVPAASQATFTVSGDSGQAISVTVPETVGLASAGGQETAFLTTTNNLSDGPQFLGGTFAGGGTLSFTVGGQVTLASSTVSGDMTGVMAVIAQYN